MTEAGKGLEMGETLQEGLVWLTSQDGVIGGMNGRLEAKMGGHGAGL